MKIFKNKINSSKKIKGFTIVETLITLLAITIMITAPLTFMYRSYDYSRLIKNKIISTGLAQEGLEFATSLRNKDLNAFILVANNCSSGCMADWDGTSALPTFDTCTDESCALFKSSTDSNQLYRKVGDTQTDQYRTIKFTANGTQSYTVESIAWSKLNDIKVEANIKKIIFNIKIK